LRLRLEVAADHGFGRLARSDSFEANGQDPAASLSGGDAARRRLIFEEHDGADVKVLGPIGEWLDL
jgi:hypothetical protein